MADAKTNYDFVQNFGLNYVKVATMLVSYYVGVVSILNKHSTCDEDSMAQPSCKYYISFMALRAEVDDAMFKHAGKLKETMNLLPKKCEKPTPEAKWPWNQKCEDLGGKCNYEYLLLMPETDQLATVNKCEGGGCKMLINEMHHKNDIIKQCNRGSNAYYGGILGWQDGQELPTMMIGGNTWKHALCTHAANIANKGGHDFSMFAIPRYVCPTSDR